MCDRVRSEFIQPLRHSLESTKLQCRGEREWQNGGRYTLLLVMSVYIVCVTGVRGEGGPDVSVEVVGEEVPDITAEDQRKVGHTGPQLPQPVMAVSMSLQMLQMAEHQLDMIECVLVRVEELLEST